jgi:hypothetical protein
VERGVERRVERGVVSQVVRRVVHDTVGRSGLAVPSGDSWMSLSAVFRMRAPTFPAPRPPCALRRGTKSRCQRTEEGSEGPSSVWSHWSPGQREGVGGSSIPRSTPPPRGRCHCTHLYVRTQRQKFSALSDLASRNMPLFPTNTGTQKKPKIYTDVHYGKNTEKTSDFVVKNKSWICRNVTGTKR